MRTDPFCPRIALTSGEPAGIGPDIVIQAAQQSFPAELVVIADPELLAQRAKLLRLPLALSHYTPATPPQQHVPGTLKIIPVATGRECTPGRPDPATAGYVLDTLRIACRGCLQREFAAMVTAPVQKSVINDAGHPFTGHTEFLAGFCGATCPVMMLADRQLRVALVTTHLPLSAVNRMITKERLTNVINVILHDLQERFAIATPRLLVCGLNPHAGEGGYLGREEIEIISPVLEQMRGNGVRIVGPVPADTAFTPEHLAQADVVVSMFHDQGLPVLKSRGFGGIVNITLGLPIIRTSVDHGTALSLAGTGKAGCTSLIAAVKCATGMAHTEHRRAGPVFMAQTDPAQSV
ncbi:MAG: 4-hydroxythreonine-4-phosphate dehydrogenase PdxA [Gammaproteobacteria bacterium]